MFDPGVDIQTFAIFKQLIVEWVKPVLVYKRGSKIDDIGLLIATHDHIGFGFQITMADSS